MSTETPTPTVRTRSRWRSFFVGSALVLSGVIIGIGTTAMSQGMHRGWSDDGPGRYERFGQDRDRDGPRGWRFGGDGPRWFGRDRDGWHGGHGFGGFGGGAFLTPGRIERMVDRLGWAVDASSEQKQKIRGIVQRAA